MSEESVAIVGLMHRCQEIHVLRGTDDPAQLTSVAVAAELQDLDEEPRAESPGLQL